MTTATPDDLIALVRTYNPRTNEAMIRDAWAFGQAMHEGQFRQSGEPYFTHPVAVAKILAEQQMDDATIITALLHDTIEDTKASFAEVERRFGREIAELVDGVTKLTNLQLNSKETRQAENFRKLFMATSRDLRVTLVKLADRLHNMRTIKSMKPEKQAQKARETMDIYAPLAGRMGMQWMREELEDMAFRVLNPEARNSIIRRFIMLQRESGDVIQKITADMRVELEKAGIEAEVFGRAKKPYSIWRKMEEKEQGFSRLSDIYGFRVITATRRIATASSAPSTSAGVPCRGGSRTISRSRNRTATVPSTPPCRGAMASASRSRSARAKCTRSPKPAWQHTVLSRWRTRREPLCRRSGALDRAGHRTFRRGSRSRGVSRGRQA